ncbi:hypothetical protein ACRQ5D_24965 [Mucilaginibacter sp. P25]|uniref:hypothetical protein n=1 Tax=unclassified Mucilaginibacter TaxID=2617802 RepID=UPI003D67518C
MKAGVQPYVIHTQHDKAQAWQVREQCALVNQVKIIRVYQIGGNQIGKGQNTYQHSEKTEKLISRALSLCRRVNMRDKDRFTVLENNIPWKKRIGNNI